MRITTEDLLAILTVVLVFLAVLVSSIFLWFAIALCIIQIVLYHRH